MSDRHAFLASLAALPMLGGGVKLIGQPTATAVPVTDALHDRYFAWLAHEHHAAMKEHSYRAALASVRHRPDRSGAENEAYARRSAAETNYIGFMPDTPDIRRIVGTAAPSTRAAVILSAAGVPLTGGVNA